MSCLAVQIDIVTTAKSEKCPWKNINGGASTSKSSYHVTSGRSHQEGESSTSRGEKPGRRSFECILCGPKRKFFTQKQVLSRHLREKHRPGFRCSRPDCDHVWTQSRRSEYKKHLRKKHRLESDEIDEILAQSPMPRVIEGNLQPLIDAPHASPPLIPSVAYSPRLVDGEPEITTTEHEDGGLEHLGITHAPSRLLSEEDSALVKGHYKMYGRFRFPPGHPGTADIPPNTGMLHDIPTLPAQQPGMQRPWFSSGTHAPQASYPAPPPPTQQTPAPSEEVWDGNYLAVHGTQASTSRAAGEVES